MSQQKNGKIEFFRFIFALSVLFYHMVKWNYEPISLSHGVHFAFFPKGNMGVDFFFVLSGLLMAKSAFKRKDLIPESSEYGKFVWGKYKTVFPQHSVAFIFTLVLAIVSFEGICQRDIAQLVIDNIPNFLLISMTGIKVGDVNGPIWYISSMLIGVAILYPICRKYYYYFTRFFAPLISLLILGYFQQTSGSVVDMLAWETIMFKGTIRGIADLLLGTAAYELSKHLNKMGSFESVKGRVILLLIEITLLAVSILFMVLTLPQYYQVFEILIFFLLISIAFSERAYGSEMFNNKVCYFMGKLSLSIYVSQRASYYIACLLPISSVSVRCILMVAITFCLAIIVRYLSRFVESIINRIESELIKVR